MKFNKQRLSNGIRVITAPIKGTETATVMIMVGVGSRYETEQQAGLSHFVEHMLFKGTGKRPTALSITEEIDAIGGDLNAFTGQDKTAYYVKVDARHIDTALSMLSDIFLHSKFDAKEIEKEKGAIIQEISMFEDSPMRNVHDVFEDILYHGNALGVGIAGSKETVNSFKRKDFLDYVQQNYTAENTVICIAGKFDEKSIEEKVSKYFGEKIPQTQKGTFVSVVEKQSNPAVRIKQKKTDQTHFIFGSRAIDQNHPDRFALEILAVILGGNMSSRLFTEIREKRGLAYYVRTSVSFFHDCGHIASQAGVEHKNLEKAIETIAGEYQKISTEKVSEKELKNAKEYYKGKTIMEMEASDEVAGYLLEQEVMRGEIMSMNEVFARIDAVTTDDVLRIAKFALDPKKWNIGIIGPHTKKSEIELKKVLAKY